MDFLSVGSDIQHLLRAVSPGTLHDGSHEKETKVEGRLMLKQGMHRKGRSRSYGDNEDILSVERIYVLFLTYVRILLSCMSVQHVCAWFP